MRQSRKDNEKKYKAYDQACVHCSQKFQATPKRQVREEPRSKCLILVS